MSENNGVFDAIRMQAPLALRQAAARIEAAKDTGPVLADLRHLRADVRDWAEGLKGGSEPKIRLVAPPTRWMMDLPPPRRWLLRHPDRDGQPCGPSEGDGLLSRGITGILAGEGGSSKTQVLLQLGVSMATGRPWLGRFVVDRAVRWSSARVLLALAEEDEDEVRRRLHMIARTLDLTEREREAVTDRVRIAPLTGVDVGLLTSDPSGAILRSAAAEELSVILANEGGTDGWALVGLDPLARWAGLEIESDNRLATRWIEVLEGIAQHAPGRPTVLVAAHSSKLARRNEVVDARGVTALTDGARWFATLRLTDTGALELTQAKSNYSRPWANPVPLERGPGGILRALDESDTLARRAAVTEERARARDEARARQAEADLATVLAALDAAGGVVPGKEALTALGQERGISRARARAATEVAVTRGLVRADGATSARTLRRATPTTSAASADSRQTPAGGSASSSPRRGLVVEAPAAEDADLFQGASATSGPAEDAPSADHGKTPTGEVAGEVGR